MCPHIDIDITWDEKRWRPIDPEGEGVPIAWSATWFEDNPLHDGPEPMGDEGALDTLLPRVAEILGYPGLIPTAGIHIDISGWALHYLPTDTR
jgi:hypothetical protein